jgi:hypothetical protein
VRRLWISEARLADSTRASRLRSLLLEAAIYALRHASIRYQKQTEHEQPTSPGSLHDFALSSPLSQAGTYA